MRTQDIRPSIDLCTREYQENRHGLQIGGVYLPGLWNSASALNHCRYNMGGNHIHPYNFLFFIPGWLCWKS
jgi:hypothetical protein